MSKELQYDQADGKLRGVFSTIQLARIGHGTTRRNTEQRVYFYVEEVEEDRFGLQSLNTKYVPSGKISYISKEELLKNYLPEPEVYMDKMQPALRELNKTVARAERHYKRGETYSAEYEFKNALRVDEENIRATFGLGLTYLSRGERELGDLVFRRLVSLRGAFEEKHKHLFNEFGIQLRKNDMLPQALKYYSRAYQLTKDDENLMYNMARTLFEKGNLKASRRFLSKALHLRSDFEEAKSMMKVIDNKLGKSDVIIGS